VLDIELDYGEIPKSWLFLCYEEFLAISPFCLDNTPDGFKIQYVKIWSFK